MAVTSNTYTVGGSGQAGPYSYSFPILADADVKVSVNGVVKSVTTHYTLDSSNTRITFVSGQEPSTGDKVIVYRNTDEDPINAALMQKIRDRRGQKALLQQGSIPEIQRLNKELKKHGI